MSTRADGDRASFRAGSPVAVGPHGVVTVLLVAAIVLAVAETVVGASAREPVVGIAVFAAVEAGLVLAGLVVLRDPSHAGLGALLLGVAATQALSNLVSRPQFGPFPFAAGPLGGLNAAVFAHLLIRWPDGRVGSRVARVLLGVLYGVLPLLSLLWQVTWSTRLYDFDASQWWWLTIVPAEDFSVTVYDVQQALFVAAIVGALVVVVVRVLRARGDRRRAMLPVAGVATLIGAITGLSALQQIGVIPTLDLTIAQYVAVLAVPVGVLVAARLEHRRGGIAVPGASPDPFAVFRARYRLGLAAITTGAVLVVVLIAIGLGGRDIDTAPAPVPGPEVAVR